MRRVKEKVEVIQLGAMPENLQIRFLPWIDCYFNFPGLVQRNGVQFLDWAGAGLANKVFDFELWSGRWVAVFKCKVEERQHAGQSDSPASVGGVEGTHG